MQLASGSHIPDGLPAAILLLSEKPRHGVESGNPAPHPDIDERNSTLAIGLRASLALHAVRQSERARYDSSGTGRWISPDWSSIPEAVPYADLANPQTLNLYGYMLDSPLDGVDQDGHQITIPFPEAGPPIPIPAPLTPAQANFIQNWASEHFSNFVPAFKAVVKEDVSTVEHTVSHIFQASQSKSKVPLATAGSKRGSRRPTKDVRAKSDQAATDSSGKMHCAYCGQELTTEPGKPNSREYDHVNPWSKGGDSSEENIRDACRTCNRQKGPRTPGEWGGPNP